MTAMQRKITGKKIAYRPLMEADLSSLEKEQAYRRQLLAERVALAIKAELKEASMEIVARKPNSARWYCLRVEKNHEFAVEKLLTDAGVEAYMPREKFMRVHRGKKFEGEIPFFPSYLLVRCVPSSLAFIGLRKQKHVVDIVGGPNGYHIVRDQDVQRFKAHTEDCSTPRVATDKTMKEGDLATITEGPFTGFDCLIVSVKWSRQAKAAVAIDVDGRVFPIDSMPLAFLKKL